MMKKGRTTSSSIDPFLTKIVSNKFNEIIEDLCFYQHINIIDLETVNPLRSWGTFDKVSNFINRCIQCCNSKALYMVGIHGGDTWWGYDTSSKTTRKKPELSGVTVQSPRAIKWQRTCTVPS
ncbi:hypothetical protein DVH24_004870 [Malus domestica]|uniref:Uncharacterized protein n=1 Tax=Malus domestica TaxID=3750 RepID=A0A498IBW2_MALDO|nr:hypothetical protein DVH24_004870 [Malus domestica]